MNSLTARLQQELKRIKPATVLLVEPDPYLGRMLSDYLADYTCQVVENGRDALATCQQTPPHLLLMDTDLPDMAALELFQQLHPLKLSHHIPVFFLAQPDDGRDQRMKALEMGVDDYIAKPFDVVELQFRVKNALPRPAQSVDLVTGQPGWPAIHQDLQARLNQPDWTLLLIHVAHMGAYQDVYGAVAGQRVRRTIADLLNGALDELGELDDLVGVLSTHEFVLITRNQQPCWLLTQLQQQFAAAIRRWYSPAELAAAQIQLSDGRRAPLMMLATAVVPARSASFATPLEVIDAAETLRQRQYPATVEKAVPSLQAIFATS
ncbi:MAG: response regulator [Anaerolineae bacterium]|nr:response regulator [Anaerolineae bacterium]